DIFKVTGAKALPVKLDRERTRDVLYVTGILGGDTFYVFVNHWSSRRGGEAASSWKREKGAQVCRQEINKILAKNEAAKIIVMGDFNDDPVSPSIVKTLNSTGNRHKIKKEQLFNPWVEPYKRGVGTLGYN